MAWNVEMGAGILVMSPILVSGMSSLHALKGDMVIHIPVRMINVSVTASGLQLHCALRCSTAVLNSVKKQTPLSYC